jgi:hypothetical protein
MITFVFGALLYLSEGDSIRILDQKLDSAQPSLPDATTTGAPAGKSPKISDALVSINPERISMGLISEGVSSSRHRM